MAYGFEIKNDAGRVVVDASLPVMGLASLGSVTTDSVYGRIPISLTGSELPMFGLEVNREIRPQYNTTTDYFLYYVLDGAVLTSTSLSLATIKPYGELTPDTYGVSVFDENSNLLFNSGKALVSLRQSIADKLTSAVSSRTHTISSDVTHVYFISSLYGFSEFPGPQGLMHAPVIQRVSATQIKVISKEVGGGVGVNYGPVDAPYKILTAKIV